MRQHKSLVRVAGVVLGSIGMAVCLALIIFIWVAGNRFGRATERLLSSTERALLVARQRVVRTQERVALAKNFAEEIENSLVDRTNQDASQREVQKRTATEKAGQLSSTLEQSDRWLEVVESSVGRVGELLASGTVASPSMGTASVDQLIEELVSLRTKIG